MLQPLILISGEIVLLKTDNYQKHGRYLRWGWYIGDIRNKHSFSSESRPCKKGLGAEIWLISEKEYNY